MKAKRKIVYIDEERCNGCGKCVNACAEGAIELLNGKARLVAEKYCDGLAACLGTCPADAIHIIEREADLFDPEAVEQYLKRNKAPGERPAENRDTPIASPPPVSAGPADPLPCGCPSTQLQMFPSQCGYNSEDRSETRQPSQLTHWPVQIKLVPPTAPFLMDADLLVASDCTAVAYPDFHKDLLKGRVVMMGCPKFDNTEEYVDKFTQVFTTANIRSVTIAVMEVPCCSKMPVIVENALARAGKKIPVRTVVIDARGNVVKEDG